MKFICLCLQLQCSPAVAAAEHIASFDRDRTTANRAHHSDRFADHGDHTFILASEHIVLEIAKVSPGARDDAHRVVDRPLLILDAQDLLPTDRLPPLLVDMVPRFASRAPQEPHIPGFAELLPGVD